MNNHLAPYITDATILGMERDGPRGIVLRYVDRIVIEISYADDLPEGVSLLGELDANGAGLAVVPLASVKKFHAWDEAENIARCMEADKRLLSYAR